MIMTPKEIAQYVHRWWAGRRMLEKDYWYSAECYLDNSGNYIVKVHLQSGTWHYAISVYPNGYQYTCFQQDQRHFTGFKPADGLTKRKLLDMMKRQQRIIEHSTTI